MAEGLPYVDQRENESTENRKAPIYDHPVFREISLSNGKINKMKKDEVKKILKERGLDTRGVKEVLQKRLKNHIKKEKLAQAKLEQKKIMNEVHFYCVIDFEGTCEENNPDNYIHEIIEFPAVLLDAVTLEKVSEFHEYCKPQDKPELSQFCQNLTGVTQEIVDNADTFSGVLDNFHQWLRDHKLGSEYKFAVVTDGPYDMKRFFSGQCQLCSIPIPKYARKWINLRKLYRNFYKVLNGTLEDMVNNLGMKFEGRPHCGMDDARNIARILRKMVQDGCEIKFNESLYGNS
ncbi:3'-5' exoribonuclease 1-like [Pocillopora verrucosa]|uniref:3'-5' exoribonuclease 1-like n=1 Tax=Pocillopora verrucosa TaxID=203993 RepID=UPI0027978FEB|nr:3'-5' exoribonuclease 1-like [Pocillopora verrucosa]